MISPENEPITSEVIDDLQIETSMLSPKTRESIKATSRQVVSSLVDTYQMDELFPKGKGIHESHS